MKKIAWFLFAFSFVSIEVFGSDCMILLHGLARSSSSMSKMEKALIEAGYHVVNADYPSRKNNIQTLAKDTVPKAISQCAGNEYIHFVTHSMGGILVRQYLSQKRIENLKHVVMLGPPNQGSEVVDKIKNVPGFKALNGPAGLQLGTDDKSVPNSLGPATFNLGIIAGNRTMNPIMSLMLPNPDDGKVSVARTKLEGMNDHITMPVTHTFMMKNKKVIAQVLHFLEHDEFDQ